MSVVIKVENLSKYYRLGVIGGGTLREDLGRWWAMRRGRPDPLLKIGEKDHGNRKDGQIWALRDVNLEVKEGEILGIIGGNGAGKSTLLKIISRITAPTHGRIKIKGRIASLLEVGTGFHPELTGRENIYLNGAIFGMSRREVSRKLEEIVQFAEMKQFVDTPVKRYSSGMTVRLAFAVAAHLEPEIMVIDEVLAVGDAEFQRRCIGKMDDVAKSGRTVLFVSHNMASIRQLAPRSILIHQGQVLFDGKTETTLNQYLGHSVSGPTDSKAIVKTKRLNWGGDRSLEFVDVSFERDPRQAPSEPLSIIIRLRANMDSGPVRIGTTICLTDGAPLASSFSNTLPSIAIGTEESFALRIEAPYLAPGHYWFTLGLLNTRNQVIDVIDEVLHFDIPTKHNVPEEFIHWDSNWGPLRLGAKLSRVE